MLKGITVTLIQRVKTGVDAFNDPVFVEVPVQVDNVLVTPGKTSDVVNSTQLDGKTVAYTLSIPKGDTHRWEDTFVEFFGQRFRTVGFSREYIEHMLPLCWNKQVEVERYG